MVRPEDHLRRTPLLARIEAHDVDHDVAWHALGDTAVAWNLGTGADPRRLAIADLSPLPRIGFKGRETIPAMQKRGLTLDATPNRAHVQADGGLCLVLAASEVVILGPLSGEASGIAQLEASWKLEDGERTFPIMRRDGNAWFAISGDKAPQMFAKICGVDLRNKNFPNLSIAQTSIAKLNGIVARADRGGTTVFHLLADSASARYLFECLLDASAEFGGKPTGLMAIRDLGSS